MALLRIEAFLAAIESSAVLKLLSITVLILTPAMACAQSLVPGTLLSFRGSVAPVDRDRTAQKAEKTFDLLLLVAEDPDEGKRILWTIDERGRGAWPWVQRFGSLTLDAKLRKSGQPSPALLYDLGESKSSIEVPLPILAAESPLAADIQWDEGAWKYVVQKATKLDDRDVWQVQVSNNYGPKRTLWVSKDGPLAVGVNERVFMGMGQEYLLELRLLGSETVSAEQLRQTTSVFERLIGLRTGLNLAERKETLDFNNQQRTLLAQQLPSLATQATGTPLERVTRSASRDFEQQSDRADAVHKLAAAQTGRMAPDFAVEGLSQESLSQKDLVGKVTVLHFWDYRDSPLQEPYGQVGYLDFLSQRRKADGVKVFGVAVDGRLADPAERSQALRGIRKLKAFMNLSYPILLDSGDVIRKFGDPRTTGAELPLFVVIGADGKIAHYHAGMYPVDRNEGLRDLNAAVTRALGQ